MKNIVKWSILSLLILIDLTEGVCKTGKLTDVEQAILDKHNELRKLHEDTPDLCYGETGKDITFSSETWAKKMVDGEGFQHSDSSDFGNSKTNPYGENLYFYATTADYPPQSDSYEEGTQAWYDEINDYDFDTNKKTSADKVVGHFTQLVWKKSEQLNCAYIEYEMEQKGRTWNSLYVVCQYYPAGNYVGQNEENVMPLSEDDNGDDTANKCAWEWQDTDTCQSMDDTSSTSGSTCMKKREQVCECTSGTKGTCDGTAQQKYEKCEDSDCSSDNGDECAWAWDKTQIQDAECEAREAATGTAYCSKMYEQTCQCKDSITSTSNECDGDAETKEESCTCEDDTDDGDECKWVWEQDDTCANVTINSKDMCGKKHYQICECATGTTGECSGDAEAEKYRTCKDSECEDDTDDGDECKWVWKKADTCTTVTKDGKDICGKKSYQMCECASGATGTCSGAAEAEKYRKCKNSACSSNNKCAWAWDKTQDAECESRETAAGVEYCSKMYEQTCQCKDSATATECEGDAETREAKCQSCKDDNGDGCAWAWDKTQVQDAECEAREAATGVKYCSKMYKQTCQCKDSATATECEGDAETADIRCGEINSLGGCGDDDSAQYEVKLKLSNRNVQAESWGIVLGALVEENTTDKDEDWAFLCNDGVGRNEANAVCRSFGYKFGRQISSSMVTKKTQDLSFGATNINCPEGARSPNDCSFDLYENAEIPCVSGQELAVACADEKFIFEISKTAAKIKFKDGKSKTKFSVKTKVERYGLPMSSNVELYVLNRSSKGEYTKIDSKFKYNKKSDSWKGKGLLTETDYCIIYVAVLSETHGTVAIGDCSYKGLTVAKVEEEVTAAESR